MANRFGAGKSAIVGSGHTTAQARGEAAEAQAERFLSSKGLKTLARRVRCRGGEIDLICLDGSTLVFVEVRLRRPGRFGSAADSITLIKRQRIIQAAHWWLGSSGRSHAARAMRFDAVLFDGPETGSPEWLRSAFDANGW